MNNNASSLFLKMAVGSRPERTLVRVAVLALISFLVFRYAWRPILVDGKSMEPTIRDRSFHFANLLAYRSRPPRRGEIVVIDKDAFSTMYLKRIIGLPGETLAFVDGDLLVNGRLVPEPYLKWKGDWEMQPVELRPGEYLVAGDNRYVPRRSHVMGVVRDEFILGRLIGD